MNCAGFAAADGRQHLMTQAVSIAVEDVSQVGEARRAAAQVAKAAGLPESQAGKVALIVTELANNLHKYGRAGKIVLQVLTTGRGVAVETLSIDQGPGMSDLRRCQEDGFSTGGTPGGGLGAVQRMSTEFDVYSSCPNGTVVLSRVYADPYAGLKRAGVVWGGLSFPARGETVCGDVWRIVESESGAAVMVADGLGHGPSAYEAAEAAAKVFQADPFAGPARFLSSAHAQIAGTRGAAVAAARFEKSSQTLYYGGIGNISGTLMTAVGRRGLFTHNGIVGAQARKPHELTYPWPPAGLLVMHSDGLRSRWGLESYAGLFGRHPGVVAAVLVRDFLRGNDDATAVALRLPGGAS